MELTSSQKLIYDMEKFAGGSISIICGSMLLNGKKPQSELLGATGALFRLNDALRIRVCETNGVVTQSVSECIDQDIEVLSFENKTELDDYAQHYAQIPLDLHGSLCEIKIITMPCHYGLLVKLHHVIGDAWTLALIGNQFNALLDGHTPTAHSYLDHIESECGYCHSSRYCKDRDYFLERFQKCSEVTYLSEKQTRSYAAARKTFVIDTNSAKQITNYAHVKDTSAFLLFTTALAVYLNRTKMNVEKFYIGTAVLNRSGTKEKNTAGMFVNTVPLLIELDNTKSFADNLATIKQSAFSVFRHQKFHYGDTLLAIRNAYGFNEKLYDVVLSYQNATITGSGFETTWYHNGMQTDSLQIHIDDRDNEGVFRIHYDYLTDKFTEHEIQMLHNHIENLLFDAISQESKKLYELELLTAEECQKLLFEFNDTDVPYPKDKCVHTLFEEQVEKTPNKVAVVACDKTMTYAELNDEANCIAKNLSQSGVVPNDIVAIMLPRNSSLIVTMFGIMKAGAAYFPIDPNYPEERINNLLKTSHAKICITTENYNSFCRLSDSSLSSLSILPSNYYCALHTSGSTGQPKCLVLRHQSLINCLYAHRGFYNEVRYSISLTNVTFDAFFLDAIGPIVLGISTVLATDAQIQNQHHLEALLSLYSDLLIAITPTKLTSYLVNSRQREAFENIRVLLCGGEMFSDELLEMLNCYPNIKIVNSYGPAETTCGVTYDTLKSGKEITIGKPIANTRIYIVNSYMQPTPIGVTGELCIAGDCVGAGYLNRPELTAEKFIENPFGRGKLYKTGDLAYWREDGNIVYVGRNDFQVKVRGLRIELGEIESVMSGFEGIQLVAVTDKRDETGRQYLVGYYTAEIEIDEKELRRYLSAKLPKYMVPNYFVHLLEMPMTVSGKIDRKNLPVPDFTEQECNYIAPETPTEQKIAAIWEKLLNATHISKSDDFFDLGGDSLVAIHLLNKLESTFDVDITVKDIFEHSELAQIAIFIDNAEISDMQIFPVAAKQYELLPQQMAIYSACSKDTETLAYNMPTRIKLPDSIDRDKLKSCMLRLPELHPELKTCIRIVDGIPCAVLDEDAQLVIEERQNKHDFLRPFDLSKAPLLRVAFTEDAMLFDMHHIIADGESLNIILRDIAMLYAEMNPASPAIQYADYAAYFRCADFSEHKAFFKDMLKCDFEPMVLPEKRHKEQDCGVSRFYQIDKQTFEQGRRIARAHKLTDTMLFLGAFGILLSKYTGRTDVLSSIILTNRVHKETENVTGMFVNTLPVMLPAKGTIAEYLAGVRELVLNLFKYQELPFFSVAEAVGMHDKNAINTSFVYQADGMKTMSIGEMKLTPQWIETQTAKFDLSFELTPNENGCAVRIEYNCGKYEDSLIDRLFDAYLRVIEQLDKEQISDVSVLSPEEYQKVIFDFNDTAVEYPRDKCVHELFMEQAARTPDKVALIFEDTQFTYRELDELSNGLAAHLLEEGLETNQVVGVLLERSELVIISQLAVLKAGGVFLPIDRRYPRDRVEYLLSDCDVKFILTKGEFKAQTASKTIDLNTLELHCHHRISVDNSFDNSCYIIYTSGSTGKPKGCLLTHRGVANFCNNNNIITYCNTLPHKIAISVNTISFDFFIAESLLPLVNGWTVVLTNETQSDFKDGFAKTLVKTGANIVQTTPTRLKIYTKNESENSYFSQVEVVVTSGETLTEELLSTLRRVGKAKIFNPLGPSECSVWNLGGEFSSEITLGCPIANTQVYILDNCHKPLPIGVAGELCISGDGVGKGYLNRPELTAEKFIPNPFVPGKTMYCTGDLARWRTDGEIEYLGRIDTQVKIRGLRIELGEIESVISSFEGIQLAAVTDKRDETGRQYLVGYYTADAEIDEKELRRHLSAKLPKYMVPNYFVHLDEMPMTASGKTDRKNLPEVTLCKLDAGVEYVPPVGELEQRLAALMEQVLSYSPIGRDDDFFDLGGDSLKAIEFVSMAHKDCFYFSLQSIFDYPTVKALATYLESDDKSSVSYTAVNFTEVNRLLAKKCVESPVIPDKKDVGNLLLAGATGYLGIHILAEYLENDKGTAYCLVRSENQESSEKRLSELLNFYFDGKYVELLDGRIQVICGDLQKDNLGLTDPEYTHLLSEVSTVINAAASVKHYGSYQYFYETNVESVKQLIRFCFAAGSKLIHISTLSVSGNSFADHFDGYVSETEKHFYESNLYIGQSLENVYARSKFEAELAVLNAIGNGLQANIMRMGNLTNRLSDGVFQKNYESNAFLNRVKAILEMGVFPDYLLNIYSEFTPVDEAASAVMTITQHFSMERIVFHINSTKVVYMDRLVTYFRELGFHMEVIGGKEFTKALRKTIEQTNTAFIFETFINDLDADDQLNYDSKIRIENDFTIQYLRRLGFEWSDIGLEYLRKYVAYFRKIRYLR